MSLYFKRLFADQGPLYFSEIVDNFQVDLTNCQQNEKFWFNVQREVTYGGGAFESSGNFHIHSLGRAKTFISPKKIGIFLCWTTTNLLFYFFSLCNDFMKTGVENSLCWRHFGPFFLSTASLLSPASQSGCGVRVRNKQQLS